MNRRHLIQLSLLAALAPGGLVQAAPKKTTPTGSPKKGLGIGGKSPDFKRKLEELNCKWVYTWTGKKPENTPRKVDFIPMIWSYSGNPESIATVGAAAKKERIKELLGFNEPDQSSQANMSVETALDAWPLLQKTGLRLGSPGCVHPDREWMKAFMEGVQKRGLKVDFVCVHSYGSPNAAAFVKRLEAVHALYNKPIWITEFAVGDWEASSPAENRFKPDQVLKFMEEVLPLLDRLDFVERYAWFPANSTSSPLGTSSLWDEKGKLTRLGECYRDS